MFGLFTKKQKRDEASYQFQEIGFHGDRYLLELVDDIVTREQIEYFIETGTNVGSSLIYLAKRHPQIHALSCEQDVEACRRARQYAAGLANVEIHNLPSKGFQKQLAKQPSLFEKRSLFWLDAHGYGFEWPLRDEIRFIADNFKIAYIMIDDFKVPGYDCFRYDEYNGQVCSYDYIRESLGARPHQVFGPRYTDRTSKHHPLVGWGLIVLGATYEVPAAFSDRMGPATS
jgi:hypothetical protein